MHEADCQSLLEGSILKNWVDLRTYRYLLGQPLWCMSEEAEVAMLAYLHDLNIEVLHSHEFPISGVSKQARHQADATKTCTPSVWAGTSFLVVVSVCEEKGWWGLGGRGPCWNCTVERCKSGMCQIWPSRGGLHVSRHGHPICPEHCSIDAPSVIHVLDWAMSQSCNI